MSAPAAPVSNATEQLPQRQPRPSNRSNRPRATAQNQSPSPAPPVENSPFTGDLPVVDPLLSVIGSHVIGHAAEAQQHQREEHERKRIETHEKRVAQISDGKNAPAAANAPAKRNARYTQNRGQETHVAAPAGAAPAVSAPSVVAAHPQMFAPPQAQPVARVPFSRCTLVAPSSLFSRASKHAGSCEHRACA